MLTACPLECLRSSADCGSVDSDVRQPPIPVSARVRSGGTYARLDCSAIRRRPNPPSPSASAPRRRVFTDSEIIEGFLKIAFGAEYHLAGRVDRIRKYEVPVRVFADGTRADRKAQIAKIVADIAARVQHLDIAMAENNEDANVLVKLVRDRDLNRTITTFYGSERAQGDQILARSAMPVGLPQEREIRDRAFRRDPHRRQWRLRLLRLRL